MATRASPQQLLNRLYTSAMLVVKTPKTVADTMILGRRHEPDRIDLDPVRCLNEGPGGLPEQ